MIVILLKIYLVGWFISHFEPLLDLENYLFGLLPEKYHEYYIIDGIYSGLQCQKCLSFWITLIITGNIFFAIGLSMIAYIQMKFIK